MELSERERENGQINRQTIICYILSIWDDLIELAFAFLITTDENKRASEREREKYGIYVYWSIEF